MNKNTHIWEAEVRDYEVDLQGIVNNSVYFNYYEHARHIYIKTLGIDFYEWHLKGYELVLIHSDVSYKGSLKSGDSFCVTTNLSLISRLKFAFNQQITRKSDNKLINVAINTATCINKNGRPEIPEELAALLLKIAVA